MSFSKSWNCTCRSGSCNFSFLKNSLVQINSKLNLKPYDYPYIIFVSLALLFTWFNCFCLVFFVAYFSGICITTTPCNWILSTRLSEYAWCWQVSTTTLQTTIFVYSLQLCFTSYHSKGTVITPWTTYQIQVLLLLNHWILSLIFNWSKRITLNLKK